MQVSYKLRLPIAFLRVMHCVGQPTHRSVHSGKTRLCIELRNQGFRDGRSYCVKGKAATTLSVKSEFDVASTESRTTGMVGNNPG